jgi:hypothetical protein
VILRTGASSLKQIEVTVMRLADEEWFRDESVTSARSCRLCFEKDAVIHAGDLELACLNLVSL